VRVAVATGRPVLAIARESYALTLWTWAHLEQQRDIERALARGDRFDAAGLMAVALHDPKKLDPLRDEFVRSLGVRTPARQSTNTERIARARAMADKVDVLTFQRVPYNNA
jgi:hypothetical protein